MKVKSILSCISFGLYGFDVTELFVYFSELIQTERHHCRTLKILERVSFLSYLFESFHLNDN